MGVSQTWFNVCHSMIFYGHETKGKMTFEAWNGMDQKINLNGRTCFCKAGYGPQLPLPKSLFYLVHCSLFSLLGSTRVLHRLAKQTSVKSSLCSQWNLAGTTGKLHDKCSHEILGEDHDPWRRQNGTVFSTTSSPFSVRTTPKMLITRMRKKLRHPETILRKKNVYKNQEKKQRFQFFPVICSTLQYTVSALPFQFPSRSRWS